MREIPLSRGKVALVDDADYARLSAVKWYFDGRYAKRRCGQTSVYMHREVLSLQPGQCVDHIDGDPLNNRLANLRSATPLENMRNRRANAGKAQKGVTYEAAHRPRSRPWRARIRVNGRYAYLGHFASDTQAAAAYDAAAMHHFGEFARTNYPRGA